MTDRYAELRQALDAGPTPGPWRHTTYMSGTQNVEFTGARGVTFVDEVLDADARSICRDNDTKPFPWLDIAHRPEDRGDDRDPQRTRNASYIAACSPDTIRALLAERDALRTALGSVIYDMSIRARIRGYVENDVAVLDISEGILEQARAALAQEQGETS